MSETVRLTYSELAKARGITLAAARRLALRHKWKKQLGNDGLTTVWVPVSALPRDGTPDATSSPEPDLEPDGTANGHMFGAETLAQFTKAAADLVSDAMTEVRSDLRSVIPALQEAITSLRVELYAERDRAESAEKRVRELEERWERRWRLWGRR